MRGVVDNLVVEAFAPDGTNQPLDMAILPWRMRRSEMVAYTHGPQSVAENSAISAVVVTNDETRNGRVPWERLTHLLREPKVIKWSGLCVPCEMKSVFERLYQG